MEEFNRENRDENRSGKETTRQTEFTETKERAFTEEYHGVKETAAGPAKQQKPKKRASFSIATSFLAVAAVAVVGVTTIFPTSKTDVQFLNSAVSDTSVVYELSIDGAEDKDYLVVVSNDRYKSETAGKLGKNTIELSDLKPDQGYSVEVKANNGFGLQTVWNEKFYTKKSTRVTRLFEVSYQCKCSYDGNFYFRLDFQDEERNWSEFSASLTNADGDVAVRCEWTDDPHDRQAIDVSGITGGFYELKITAMDSTTGTAQEKILYQNSVEI